MNQYSITQNYLTNSKLVSKLVSNANFKESDIVIDIGAGKGIITSELSKYSKNVIAIEIDRNLYEGLKTRFPSGIKILNEDFLSFKLPTETYNVFSNIPFNKTADILNKLLSESSQLQTAYLILQKEAAYKFGGEQVGAKNTMVSLINSICFEFSIVHTFNRNDFTPSPSVDTVLLKIQRREEPILKEKEILKFKDYISYIFNKSNPGISKTKIFTDTQLKRFKNELKVSQDLRPTDISLKQYLTMFNVVSNTSQISVTEGYFRKILGEQRKIVKINRTRNDRDWKGK